MATAYPNKIDTSTELPKAFDKVTGVDAIVINRLRDAIIAIQQELGVNPSGDQSTVKDRFDVVFGLIADLQNIAGGEGVVGPTGPKGDQGDQGIQGPTGPQGTAGSNGSQGAQGPTGPQGIQGATGSAGAQGPTGPAGSAGTNGKNAFTVTYASFNWGNSGESPFFQVATGTVDWMQVGQWINISDGTHSGFLQVAAIGAEDPEAPGYQLVQGQDFATTGNPWNQIVASGATVCPAGRPA